MGPDSWLLLRINQFLQVGEDLPTPAGDGAYQLVVGGGSNSHGGWRGVPNSGGMGPDS